MPIKTLPHGHKWTLGYKVPANLRCFFVVKSSGRASVSIHNMDSLKRLKRNGNKEFPPLASFSIDPGVEIKRSFLLPENFSVDEFFYVIINEDDSDIAVDFVAGGFV